MLATASAIGTRSGNAARAAAVRTASGGTTSTASSSSGAGMRRTSRAVADHEAAAQRRADVVRMALQFGGERQQVGVELEQVVGRRQPGDDRGRG